MKHQPFTILLHIALVIIVAGAIVTHFTGIQGTLTLRLGTVPTNHFELTSGPGDGSLPFKVRLDNVEIIHYPGTSTPMDFKSRLDIDGELITIAMNKVGEWRGWRLYQTGIGGDFSTVTVSYDPWGIGITYVGYALLGIAMAGFFFQRNTPWHALLRSRKGVMTTLFLLCSATSSFASDLPAMQRPLAANLGKVYVYWNDRICPMQTMARDITLSLYGSERYKGMTPEQVLSGWLFYFDEWNRDYLTGFPEASVLPEAPKTKKEKKLVEHIALIQWLGTGEAFRIYPYHTASGMMEWLSLTGHRPSAMSLEQWTFMQTAMPRIKELLLMGKNIRANEELNALKQAQIAYAGSDILPSETKIQAERIYNVWSRPSVAGIVALLTGGVFVLFAIRKRRYPRWIQSVFELIGWFLLLYLVTLVGMLWWISGHLPLSNGPETMLFMGIAGVFGACAVRKKYTVKGCLLVVGGIALLVSAMGGRTPRIGMLMPVLSSPLLSVHVMLVMVSYVLFMLMTLLSIIALSSRKASARESLSVTNRLLLTPAICLLGAGIFVGAVWANQSWGRYWGWDPKETCALIMWLVYALPAHWACPWLRCFRRPKVLHWYLVLAIFTVIFTYFGANYLLPGLHSYA